MYPKVSIVIINFRGLKDTIECLISVRQSLYPNYDIIVVDNGSNDGSVPVIRKLFPEVTIMEADRNLGFAEGNNLGIRYALETGAEYIFLLNNDAIIDRKTICHLVTIAEKDEEIGILGSAVLYYNTPTIIESVGARVTWTGGSKLIGNRAILDKNWPTVLNVDYVSGAAMLIRKQVLEKVGLLPTLYFLYAEEKDYCTRAKKAGYRIVCLTEAKVWHKSSRTVSKYKGLKTYYLTRNRLLFARIHLSTCRHLLAMIYLIFFLLPINVITCLREKNLVDLLAFIQGIIHGMKCRIGCTREIK